MFWDGFYYELNTERHQLEGSSAPCTPTVSLPPLTIYPGTTPVCIILTCDNIYNKLWIVDHRRDLNDDDDDNEWRCQGVGDGHACILCIFVIHYIALFTTTICFWLKYLQVE